MYLLILLSRRKMVTSLNNNHRVLTNGVGKCSVPMWSNGLPAGFCDQDAFGDFIPGKETIRNGQNEIVRLDGKYNGYVPALACYAHGGPKEKSGG